MSRKLLLIIAGLAILVGVIWSLFNSKINQLKGCLGGCDLIRQAAEYGQGVVQSGGDPCGGAKLKLHQIITEFYVLREEGEGLEPGPIRVGDPTPTAQLHLENLQPDILRIEKLTWQLIGIAPNLIQKVELFSGTSLVMQGVAAADGKYVFARNEQPLATIRPTQIAEFFLKTTLSNAAPVAAEFHWELLNDEQNLTVSARNVVEGLPAACSIKREPQDPRISWETYSVLPGYFGAAMTDSGTSEITVTPGSQNHRLATLNLSASSGSNRIDALWFVNNGSARATDLTNFRLLNETTGTYLGRASTMDQDAIRIPLDPPLIITAETPVQMSLKADVTAGAANDRTIHFIIEVPDEDIEGLVTFTAAQRRAYPLYGRRLKISIPPPSAAGTSKVKKESRGSRRF